MNFNDLINSKKPVLIDFYADWCGPCKTLSPIIQEVKNDIGDEVRVVKIDVDANQAVAQKYDVRSIPTIMIFQKGELKWRVTGVQTKAAIKRKLGEYISEEEE